MGDNNIILYILSLFSVYGIISLIRDIYGHFKEKRLDNQGKLRIILAVEDKERDIERIVRNVVQQNYRPHMGNITVIDNQSQDDTLKILERLMGEYEYLDVVSTDELLERIKKYSLN